MIRGVRRAEYVVPFNRPHRTGDELLLFEQALSGVLTGNGPFTRRASELIAGLVGGGPCLLTPSCTHSLEMAALLLDLLPGDEVIMPSFTFVSTANAFVLRGAVPVFVDIRSDTFNLDETLIEEAVTPRTRAIVAVHYAGVACEMDRLSEVAERHDLVIVEDNAHGLGGRFRGEPLGSLGALAAQSFHATKNVQCGEGGALVVNNRSLLARAEILREKGTDRSQFDRGEIGRYTWVDIGSSYVLSDLLAAVLVTQLEHLGEIESGRRLVWSTYDEELRDWRDSNGVRAQRIPADCEHPAHLYALVMPSAADRDGLIRHLSSRGVVATFHYVPLHSSPGGLRLGRTAASGCDVTSDVAGRLVRLPVFSQMSTEERQLVVDSVLSYRPGRAESGS